MHRLVFSERKTDAAIKVAAHALAKGGVIAFPTETSYGLGCDPRNAKAVRRIFVIKGREKKKPLLLVASDLAQVRMVANVLRVGANRRVRPGQTHRSAPTEMLMKTFWPGPLTLVLPAKKSARLQKFVAPKGDVAIRISSSPFVRRLTKAYGFPIIATSANRSGEKECRSGRAVSQTFLKSKNQPELILDTGSLPRRKPSTVARIKPTGEIEILRQGAVRLSAA